MGHCTKAGALCEEMGLALDASKAATGGPAIVVAFAAPVSHSATVGTMVAYHIPGRGRGKAQQRSTNMVFTYCPFCGGTLR